MCCLGIGSNLKILIIGGYGTFGGRLVELLSGIEALTLYIAGRSESKAIKFISKLSIGAAKIPFHLDRDGDLEKQISSIEPNLVIDASGPFQFYGDDPYRVVKACISQHANYMDLADGAQFVSGIEQFDKEAKARGLYILSGVSSFPVLTAAVVRHLSNDMAQVTDIRGGIAPSPYAGVGLNVIRAIASYAGKPVTIISKGRKKTAYALTHSFDYCIAPPGFLPLRKTRFSLMDVPDIVVLPKIWPGLKSMWMGAGPVPAVFHEMLRGFAWLVRLRILPSLSLLAPLFHFVSNTLRWGEHRGGMFVSVTGTKHAGGIVERSWHLVAEGDDGPYIPSMAIEGIVRGSLHGIIPRAGARPCIDELELSDYDGLFKNHNVHTGIRELGTPSTLHSLYQKTLANSWNLLPEALKEMHAPAEDFEAKGEAQVQRGKGFLPAIVTTLFRFPKSVENIDVCVSFKTKGNKELWQRTFGNKSFSSTQTDGSTTGLISEQFGPFAFDLALVIKDKKLLFIVRDWYFFKLRMPRTLAPTGNSYEFSKDERFHFHVEIAHPLIGLIVRYSGWLVPVRSPGHALPTRV
jgi:hypothetical protein